MSDNEPNYNDRMFLEGQAIYERISNGEIFDVEAALMDAALRNSTDEDQR